MDTSGISASAPATIRRGLSEAPDPGWSRLLEIVAPYRAKIRRRFANDATRRLGVRQLTSPDAMTKLADKGIESLRRSCEQLMEQS